MRLRNKPWAPALIQQHPEFILVDPPQMAGQWQKRFAKSQPLELELGSGKGQFIMEKARQNPQINFIAMEVQTAAIAMILKKQVVEQLPNLQLLQANGRDLLNYFAAQEISKLYLNFSDPWPKKKHTKRRLVAPNFLQMYQQILASQGQIEFKTDNQGLFEYALLSLNNFSAQFNRISLNLHASAYAASNIPTEYEDKFTQKGQPIFYLQAQLRSQKKDCPLNNTAEQSL